MAVTLFHFLWRCGGQYDNKYVAFELLMHAALAADEIGGFMPEPARIQVLKIKYRVWILIQTIMNQAPHRDTTLARDLARATTYLTFLLVPENDYYHFATTYE